jgi:hypothetical protein
MTNQKTLFVILGSFVLAFASLPSEAGWKIKLGDKVIAGKEDKKDEKKPDGQQPAAATPSIVCDSAQTIHICYAFTGTGNAEDKTAKGNQFACKFMKGRYLASSTCSTEGALGVCTVLKGQPKEYKLYYHPGEKTNFTKESAEKDCKNPKSSLHVQGPGEWSGL